MSSIEDIRSTFDRLFVDLSALLDEGNKISIRQGQIDEFERRLREVERKLSVREKVLEEKSQKLDEEKLYVARYLRDIKEKEIKDSIIQDNIKKLSDQEITLKNEQRQMRGLQEETDKKIAELAKLTNLQKELDYRESLLKKEALTIAIKKEAVDGQEEANSVERTRLQKIAEQLQEKQVN